VLLRHRNVDDISGFEPRRLFFLLWTPGLFVVVFDKVHLMCEELQCLLFVKVTVKVKERIAVNGFPSHSYGTSLPYRITVLPATRHK